MGRGAEQSTRRAADEERARQDALNQQLLDERGQQRKLLLGQYQNLLGNPGYSEAEKAAITGESMGALGSAFDALTNRAANRVAHTGNAAGYGELLDELAREQGRESADVARQNQVNFADEAYNRRLAALGGLGSLYGVDTRLLQRGLGIPGQLLGVRAQASRGGGFNFGLSGGPFSFGFSG
jgi:predicted alpha/beta hydrolase